MKYDWNLNSIPILQLGSAFYDEAKPAYFPLAKLRYWNENVPLQVDRKRLWDFNPLENNLEKPLALRYHGHQFQHYNPDLGDGRGFLYAQLLVADVKNQQWYDLGTKGSGQTLYSRRGDGRLTLKGAVREALATELLESLGVNTSKTLCFYETGENLERGDEPSPTRSAVLTRFSLGHIRIGTFQRLAFLNETENIKKLTSYCLNFYYQDSIKDLDWNDDLLVASTFLRLVCERNTKLVAEVMMAGFVHGVLNTDNINISGELFDYGPYRFLPQYDPLFTAAYFDHNGLYAFGRQPHTFLWNLHQLGGCLERAFPGLPFDSILEDFSDQFNLNLQKRFLERLRLTCSDPTLVGETISLFFQMMDKNKLHFEQTFFDFYGFDKVRIQNSLQNKGYQGDIYNKLIDNLEKMKINEVDHQTNPDYFKNDKPCTLLIEEIESIWSLIAEKDDWSAFENKIKAIRKIRPF
ncbi:MAG: YdiU family protein [Bdellovibrio sp.]|nr:YdiU family protein [Bdellovibrio sp.]